jgi:hypothetical protein
MRGAGKKVDGLHSLSEAVDQSVGWCSTPSAQIIVALVASLGACLYRLLAPCCIGASGRMVGLLYLAARACVGSSWRQLSSRPKV